MSTHTVGTSLPVLVLVVEAIEASSASCRALAVPLTQNATPFTDHLSRPLQRAKALLDGYEPVMTKDEYLAFMRSNSREETFKGE